MGEPPCWRWLFPLEGQYMTVVLERLSKEFVHLPYIERTVDVQFEADEISLETKKNQ